MCSGVLDCLHLAADYAMAVALGVAFLIWIEAVGIGGAIW